MAYFENLYNKLINEGFNPLEGFYDNKEITENSKFAGLLKMDRYIWYVAVVSDLNNISFSDVVSLNKNNEENFQALIRQYNLKNIIVLNIMLSDKITDTLKLNVDNSSMFLNERLNSVYWAVENSTGDVYIKDGQVTDMWDMRKILKSSSEETNKGAIIALHERQQEGGITKINNYKNFTPVLTYMLIIINLIMFAILEFSGGSRDLYTLLAFGANEPSLVFGGQYYRLFTAMFLHSGLTHLMYNMGSLYIFGYRAEQAYGKVAFLGIYIFSGLISSLFSVLFTQKISVGASGAIFGLVAAVFLAARIGKNMRVDVHAQTMGIYIVFSIAMGFFDGAVDNFGHIGGLVGGLIIGFIIIQFKNMRAREG